MFSFHHITISSRDMDISVKFYKRLGFKTVLQWSSADKELRIVHMKLDAILLEIFSYRIGKKPLQLRSRWIPTCQESELSILA